MDGHDLLAVLAAFQREKIGYAIVGALARTLRGNVDLGECIEIAVAPHNVIQACEVLRNVWPEIEGVDSPASDVILHRFLPPDSPMFLDLMASHQDLAAESIFIEGVSVRVASDVDDRQKDWMRPGFTLRERLNSLNSFLTDILPERWVPRGVRKYRSVTEADYDRNEWNEERFARLRRASASN
jgi:hypothetical protein